VAKADSLYETKYSRKITNTCCHWLTSNFLAGPLDSLSTTDGATAVVIREEYQAPSASHCQWQRPESFSICWAYQQQQLVRQTEMWGSQYAPGWPLNRRA
jgi:hypothetical protein